MKVVDKCKICNGQIERRFTPMEQWEIQGPICGKCYSKKIAEFYPGEHVRMNTSKQETNL